MKKHAIIPIFIPHKGCPNDCIFCNQRKITAHADSVSASDIHQTVSQYMSTLSDMDMETIELSFFGGSFTGIPLEEQKEYLSIAKGYKDDGVIQKIHLSTRPDYIDRKNLDNLKAYGVDVIELGVQSFAEPVLKASNRGHDAACVYESCALIKEYGFTLGIQLKIGLPEDTTEYDLFSAREAVKLRPEIARLYPTVVIKDTGLHQLMEKGLYTPPEEKDMVERTAAMYKILTDAGINVIRVGLKSSDIMSDENNTADTFHPAFRQLVEGLLARQQLEAQIDHLLFRNSGKSAKKPAEESDGRRNRKGSRRRKSRRVRSQKSPGSRMIEEIQRAGGVNAPILKQRFRVCSESHRRSRRADRTRPQQTDHRPHKQRKMQKHPLRTQGRKQTVFQRKIF
ncbi:MAG: elongator complex protein 3 [Anaerovoracaceae bacterium]